MDIRTTEFHHSDEQPTGDDILIATEIATVIGDIIMGQAGLTSREQWTEVVKALRVHGLAITEEWNV